MRARPMIKLGCGRATCCSCVAAGILAATRGAAACGPGDGRPNGRTCPRVNPSDRSKA